MANKCKDDQVRRDGKGQGQRFLPALDTSRNLIDDRKPEDLLVFAKHYAELVRFYDADKPVDLEDQSSKQGEKDDEKGAAKPIENWKEFFTKDITTVIASIAQYKNKLDWLRQEFEDKRKKTDSKPTPENFRDLFITIINHFVRFNKWYSRSIPDHPLKNEIEVKIHSTLKPALEKLISYGRGYSVLNEGKLGLRNYYLDFKAYPWNIKYDDIKGNDDIYTGINRQKKISNAALFVDDIFLIILKTYKELTDRTNFYFTYSAENYPQHKPHMALFIAFIELFGYAQKELNSITRRHLEFYYRDVLHLHERPATPDAVYLIYELAKEATEYDLKLGTPLTAGKDGLGKEMIYKTVSDLVINKAKVKEVKTIFQNILMEKIGDTTREVIKNIYASPVANSEEGNGTPFKIPETPWPTLGYFKTEKPPGQAEIIFGKEAEMGFAIASPQLFLAEGLRKISIKLPLESLAIGDLSSLNGAVNVLITGEKGWIIIKQDQNNFTDDTIGYSITNKEIEINIPVAEQAIVAYDKAIHSEGYDTAFPIIKFILKDSSKYEALKNKILIKAADVNSPFNITVTVTGVRNILLENDSNTFDPTKAIYPFTQSPKQGYSFYIGSKEIFFKKLNALSIKFDINEEILFKSPRGVGTPGDVPATLNIALLNDKSWKFIAKNDERIPFEFKPPIGILTKNITLDNHREINFSDFPSKEKSRSGFMKIDLTNEVNSTIFNDGHGTITLPKTFIIKNVEVSYSSSQDFEAGIEQYFHIYPFGIIETCPKNNFPGNLPYANFIEYTRTKDHLVVDTGYVLPQIKFGTNNDNFTGENQYKGFVYQQGNLYIGIQDLVPSQNLSLLFKIADGTAEDNDNEPPYINWSYLINNEWRPLQIENIISDSTYGLQATGIVLIDFPKDATTNNTIITKGLHWLCASVDIGADKIPKIIDIIAQANKAVFFDQENDPEHYRNPLPAKTIAKLVTKVPEVKLITQPFESFDRKMREEGNVFYARASERLRHKHRAITPWDYEHLVLQHFPWIYKVKCLSNTDPVCLCRHEEGDEAKCCCEQISPGHVLIIPVSNLRNKNAVDILKPRTGRRTLIKIEEYLRKLTSPFVHVRAKNPLFEEVKTSFKVKFHTGTDKGRYLRRLNDDIIKYLTPWAFDETKDVIFGGKVYASNIINFIEELDYVDYITCFRIIHIINDCCEKETSGDLLCSTLQRVDFTNSDDDIKITSRFKTEIQASSSRAILTSVKKHCIDLIDEPKNNDECNCS